MICKNCGAEIREEAVFCDKCGKKISTNGVDCADNKINKRNIAILSIVLVVIAIIAFLLTKGSWNNGSAAVDASTEDEVSAVVKDEVEEKNIEEESIEESDKGILEITDLSISEIVPIESEDEMCEIKYICNVNGKEVTGSVIDYDYAKTYNLDLGIDARAVSYVCDVDSDGDDEIVIYAYIIANSFGEEAGNLHIVKMVNSEPVEVLNSLEDEWQIPGYIISGIEIQNDELFFYSGEKNWLKYKASCHEEKYKLTYEDGQWKNEIVWTAESLTEFLDDCNFINGNDYFGYVRRGDTSEKGEIYANALRDVYIDYKFADFDNDSEDELLLIGHNDEQITIEIAECEDQRVIITDRINIDGCTSERFIGDTCIFTYEKDGQKYIAVETKKTMAYLGDGTDREFDLITYDGKLSNVFHFSVVGSDFDDTSEASFYNDIKGSGIDASWDKIMYEGYYIRDFIEEKIDYITCIDSWQISYGVFAEWEKSESKELRCSIITLSDSENMAYRAYNDFICGRRNVYDLNDEEKNIDEILNRDVYGYINPCYWFIKNNNSESVAMVLEFADGVSMRYGIIYYDQKTQCLRMTGSFGRESQGFSIMYDDTYVMWETIYPCGCYTLNILELDGEYELPVQDSEKAFYGFIYTDIYENHDERIHEESFRNYENITEKYKVFLNDELSIGEHYLMDNYQVNDITNRIPAY